MSPTEPARPGPGTLTQVQRIVDAMVDSLPEVAVFVLDQDLRYLVAGGAALEPAGLAAEDFLGKTVAEVVGPDLAAADEPRLRLAQAGHPFTVEHEAGSCRFVSHGVSLTVDGRRCVLVLSYDVTERHAIESGRAIVAAHETVLAWAAARRATSARERAEWGRGRVARLQESLLAGPVPRLPGAEIRARYRPADPQYRLGGDWYDATALDGHTIGLSVGDVVGSGLEAATAMGRLRAAAVTLAIDGSAPGDLLRRLERLCQAIPGSGLATIAYAALDTRRGAVRFACAGHPPPLVVAPEGGTTYLWDGRSMPLGVVDEGQPRPEGTAVLPPGSRFVLYSDGLVKQPRRSITAGLERLAEVASAAVLLSLDRFCDSLETALPDSPRRDDVAILCVELDRPARDVLEIQRPARARELAGVRASLRAWLGGHGVTDRDQRRMLLACGEACANVVEHAYGATEPGELSVWLARDAGVGLTARVQDSGRWREPSAEGLRGRGTRIMRGSVDRVEVSSTSEGTEVCLQLAL